MIKINLLGEETPAETSGQMFVLGYISSIITLIVICVVLNVNATSEITKMNSQKRTLEADLARLKEVTQEVRDLEKKKEELKNKLTIIAVLRRNKTGPVKVMDSFNRAIPDRAWVVEIQEKAGDMKIMGMALDNITISNFARELEKFEYFPKVDIVETRSSLWKGVQMRQFTLQAKVNYAGNVVKPAAPTTTLGNEGGASEGSVEGSANQGAAAEPAAPAQKEVS